VAWREEGSVNFNSMLIIAVILCMWTLAYGLGLRPTEAQMRAVVADEMCKTLVASKLAQSCTPNSQ
jgi:hypothetical protein